MHVPTAPFASPSPASYAEASHGAHDVSTAEYVDPAGNLALVDFEGRLTAYDLMLLRAWVPQNGKVEPWFEVGGGLATVQPPTLWSATVAGGQFRLGAGFDVWVSRRFSLDFGALYRMVGIAEEIGHVMGGTFGGTVHW